MHIEINNTVKSVQQITSAEYNVAQINSIKDKYPHLRQDSKRVTFAAQYGGTYITFMNNCGFDEVTAKQIEANYHKLYEASDKWVADKIAIAERQGYIDTAFGLRIRTPVIAKSVLGNSKTPNLAIAESRSVGNAVSGQSYCMLTCRALNEFMERVYASEYKHDIMPVNIVHDAIYLMIRDNIHVVKWVNDNLMDCMSWQELDEIKHDKVKLSAELELYYNGWHQPIVLPNRASRRQIKDVVKEQVQNYDTAP